MNDKQITHFVGDDCEGGHRTENADVDAGLAERVAGIEPTPREDLVRKQPTPSVEEAHRRWHLPSDCDGECEFEELAAVVRAPLEARIAELEAQQQAILNSYKGSVPPLQLRKTERERDHWKRRAEAAERAIAGDTEVVWVTREEAARLQGIDRRQLAAEKVVEAARTFQDAPHEPMMGHVPSVDDKEMGALFDALAEYDALVGKE